MSVSKFISLRVYLCEHQSFLSSTLLYLSFYYKTISNFGASKNADQQNVYYSKMLTPGLLALPRGSMHV